MQHLLEQGHCTFFLEQKCFLDINHASTGDGELTPQGIRLGCQRRLQQ